MLRWAAVCRQGPVGPILILDPWKDWLPPDLHGFYKLAFDSVEALNKFVFQVFAARKVFGCKLGKRWLDEDLSSPSFLFPSPALPPPSLLSPPLLPPPSPPPPSRPSPTTTTTTTTHALLPLFMLFFLCRPYVTKYSGHYSRNHKTGISLSLLLNRL